MIAKITQLVAALASIPAAVVAATTSLTTFNAFLDAV